MPVPVVIPKFFLDPYKAPGYRGGEQELCGENLRWGITAGPSYTANISVLNREIELLREKFT